MNQDEQQHDTTKTASDKAIHVNALVMPPSQMAGQVYMLVSAVSELILDYHFALDTREHGGIAANRLINDLQELFGMNWEQGKEKALRELRA